MFSIDQWKEIYLSIKQHKLRTFLTGFGVFLGIFLLLLLMGAGRGLEKEVNRQFSGYASNSFFAWVKTSLPYQGMNPGRRIKFTNMDLEAIRNHIPGIQHLNGSTYLQGEFTVNFGQTRGSFTILGSMPGLKVIDNLTMDAGRYINQLDYIQKRKIAIIGRNAKQVLFGNHCPLGEYIQINGVYLKVAGVFTHNHSR